MSDTNSFPPGSSKDSDDHSDKTAGKKPMRPESNDDPSSAVDRAVDTTAVLGDDTKTPSANPTVALDGSNHSQSTPATGHRADDLNQTMVIGESEDGRGLVSSKSQSDQQDAQKTVSLDRKPSRSDSSRASRGDTLSLETSNESTTSGPSHSKQQATPTMVLGQDSEATSAAPQGTDHRTMPLNAGNISPQSGSAGGAKSGTMVLGSGHDSPANTPQDAGGKTVVLGGQGSDSPTDDGPATGHRTVPREGPQSSGTRTAVLGDADPSANVTSDACMKTAVLGQGQSTRQQDAARRTVPLGELGNKPGPGHPVSEPAPTEPIGREQQDHALHPTLGNTADDFGQPPIAYPSHQSSATPLRAPSTLDSSLRAVESHQDQLIRRTTSALAFAALAIVISILCATLSSTAASVTYSCSVLALLVGMFSFWRYARLLRLLPFSD